MPRSKPQRSFPPGFRPDRLVAVILAGGRARRLGGADKALVELAGRRLIDHVIARLADQVAGLVVSANGDPGRFAATAAAVVADDVPDRPGPLAGLLAGLEWASLRGERGPDYVLSVPCDTPFLPRDLARRLFAPVAEGRAPAAVAASGGRLHPVIGLWPVAARVALRAALIGEGLRKAEAWASRFGAVPVEFGDGRGGREGGLDPFFNVNRPEDLRRAEVLLRGAGDAASGS